MKKIVFFLGLSLCSLMASAGNLNIAVVDMNKVIQSSPQMASIQTQLDKTFAPKHQTIVTKISKTTADNEKLLKNASVMKQKDRDALTQKINESRRSILAEQEKFQREYEKARTSALKGLFEKINIITTKMAKEQHYDLILNTVATPFAGKSLDVTEALVARLKKAG
jgi:outer membrane protein